MESSTLHQLLEKHNDKLSSAPPSIHIFAQILEKERILLPNQVKIFKVITNIEDYGWSYAMVPKGKNIRFKVIGDYTGWKFYKEGIEGIYIVIYNCLKRE